MARGPGVSMSALGDGRWRVRWREDELDESTGERRRVQRQKFVQDKAAALELQAKLLRAIQSGVLPSDVVPAPVLRPARVIPSFQTHRTGAEPWGAVTPSERAAVLAWMGSTGGTTTEAMDRFFPQVTDPAERTRLGTRIRMWAHRAHRTRETEVTAPTARPQGLLAELDTLRAEVERLRAADGEWLPAEPADLEATLGLDPRCSGCGRRRVPGGGLCERCLDDERRERVLG